MTRTLPVAIVVLAVVLVVALADHYAGTRIGYMLVTGDFPGMSVTGIAEDHWVVDAAITVHEVITGK